MKGSAATFAFLSVLFFALSSCTGQPGHKIPGGNDSISGNPTQGSASGLTVDTLLNDYASIISGLQPVRYFKSIYGNERFKIVQKQIEVEWQYVQENKIKKIQPWTESNMKTVTSGNNLIYPFAGADILYANLFFPQADSIVMVGLEEPGEIMADSSNQKSFISHVTKVYKSLYFSNHEGFFRTLSMREELNEPELKGTIPAMLFYIRKMGYEISSLRYLELDAKGKPVFTGNHSAYGCQVEYFSQDHVLKRLFYFKYDLSNDSLKKEPRFFRFLDGFEKPNVFLKAASYLMHTPDFTLIRDYLLAKAQCLLQDDSGIPLRDIKKNVWNLTLYGKYTKTIDLFQHKFQPSLRDAYQGPDVKSLPFSIGYNTKHGEPNLQLLTRKKK